MMTSAPSRTRAISDAKSLVASASEMWITFLAILRLYTAPLLFGLAVHHTSRVDRGFGYSVLTVNLRDFRRILHAPGRPREERCLRHRELDGHVTPNRDVHCGGRGSTRSSRSHPARLPMATYAYASGNRS